MTFLEDFKLTHYLEPGDLDHEGDRLGGFQGIIPGDFPGTVLGPRLHIGSDVDLAVVVAGRAPAKGAAFDTRADRLRVAAEQACRLSDRHPSAAPIPGIVP